MSRAPSPSALLRPPRAPVRACGAGLVAALVVMSAAAALAAPGCSAARVSGEGEGEDVDTVLLERLRAEASIAADRPYQALRFNPAPEACACPDFEVRVGEDWWRVRLEPASVEEDPLPALRAVATLGDRPDRIWYAVGRLDDDPIVVCPNGCYGFEMVVAAVTDDPPPPEEPPAVR